MLRFLKMMTPVKCVKPLYDGHIVWPEEGELHRRFPGKATSKKNLDPNRLVWSLNIDKPKGIMTQGLRLLTALSINVNGSFF